jgi:hypothetical protein
MPLPGSSAYHECHCIGGNGAISAGVGKCILHPWRPKTGSYGLTRRQKNPETPKNAIKPFGAQWILEAAGRRAALQHRPTADSGHANGWCTVRGMWTDHVRSYTTPTLALGPRLRRVLADGVLFTPKIWCLPVEYRI